MSKYPIPETLVSIYLDESDFCQNALKKKRANNKRDFFAVSQFAGKGWILISLVAVACTMLAIGLCN